MGHAPHGRDSGHALRLAGLIAVAVGLAALTAAACTLSYSSIHHLATDGSVSPRLARVYPFIFDALLVIAGCAVLALRYARMRRLGQRQDKSGTQTAAAPPADLTARPDVVVMANTAEPPPLHVPSADAAAGAHPAEPPGA